MISPVVHILTTCHNLDLLPATLLVFRTLRVGFPTAEVYVWGNNLPLEAEQAVRRSGERFTPLGATSHDAWIERLLDNSHSPFWICDTDIVFWSSVETFPGDSLLAGRYEPAFREPWSKTQKVDRLHTSLLWFNTLPLRQAIREWIARWHPKGFPFVPESELIRQQFIPQGAGKPPLFYDSCAGLYQALGGQAFTEEQNAAFEHLHCGVYSDRISSALPGLPAVHQAVWADTNAARGLLAQQANFYASN